MTTCVLHRDSHSDARCVGLQLRRTGPDAQNAQSTGSSGRLFACLSPGAVSCLQGMERRRGEKEKQAAAGGGKPQNRRDRREGGQLVGILTEHRPCQLQGARASRGCRQAQGSERTGDRGAATRSRREEPHRCRFTGVVSLCRWASALPSLFLLPVPCVSVFLFFPCSIANASVQLSARLCSPEPQRGGAAQKRRTAAPIPRADAQGHTHPIPSHPMPCSDGWTGLDWTGCATKKALKWRQGRKGKGKGKGSGCAVRMRAVRCGARRPRPSQSVAGHRCPLSHHVTS
jgi:hypothetical protein